MIQNKKNVENKENQNEDNYYNQQIAKNLKIDLKRKGDCIAQAFFIAKIIGGVNFQSDDGLFCEMILDIGPQWNLLRGAQLKSSNSQLVKEYKSIQTQTAYAQKDQMYIWSHPINLEFVVGNISGWPKGVFKVWRLDYTNKIDIISYGSMTFPKQEGYHRIEVDTWSPIGNWSFANLKHYLGSQPRLASFDVTQYNDKKNQLLGFTNGKIIIEFEVLFRNFSIIDVSGQL